MVRGVGALALVIAMTAGVPGASAQLSAAVEAGAATVQQTGLPTSAVATLSVESRAWRGSRGLHLHALGVSGGGGGTLQAAVDATQRVRLRGVRLELDAIGSTFAATRQWPVTTLQLQARAHHAVGGGGGAIFWGGSVGRTGWGGEWLPAAAGQLGAWKRGTRGIVAR
jgi:hypothetical protein